MAHVHNHRSASGDVVLDVFDRVSTEADVSRFSTALSGEAAIIHIDDSSLTDDGLPVVSAEAGGAYLFQLPFNFIVGANQLNVQVPDPTYFGSANAILYLSVPSVDDRTTAEAGWTGPAASTFPIYFEEIGPSTVRVYGIPDPTGVVKFFVPHTSVPATSRSKIVVEDQGNNESIELLGAGDGVLLRSPSGSKFLLRVDDSGVLVTEPR